MTSYLNYVVVVRWEPELFHDLRMHLFPARSFPEYSPSPERNSSKIFGNPYLFPFGGFLEYFLSPAWNSSKVFECTQPIVSRIFPFTSQDFFSAEKVPLQSREKFPLSAMGFF
jgi:hypothetical protein